MKMFMRSTLAVLLVTLASAATGHADPGCGPIREFLHFPCSKKPVDAPEMNPEMAAGALALLGGAVMVIRGRRRKA